MAKLEQEISEMFRSEPMKGAEGQLAEMFPGQGNTMDAIQFDKLLLDMITRLEQAVLRLARELDDRATHDTD